MFEGWRSLTGWQKAFNIAGLTLAVPGVVWIFLMAIMTIADPHGLLPSGYH